MALLRELVDTLSREREDLLKDRDHWREQAANQTLMLTHQQHQTPALPVIVTPSPAPAVAAPPPPRFFARLKAVFAPPASP